VTPANATMFESTVIPRELDRVTLVGRLKSVAVIMGVGRGSVSGYCLSRGLWCGCLTVPAVVPAAAGDRHQGRRRHNDTKNTSQHARLMVHLASKPTGDPDLADTIPQRLPAVDSGLRWRAQVDA